MRPDRTKILAAILSLMIGVSGYLAAIDPNVRPKFLELATLYVGSLFALMRPGNDDTPPSPK